MPKYRNANNPYLSFDGFVMFKDLMEKSKVDVSKIVVTSGYRTQSYNDSLPNSVKNSRHVKGDAIDFGGKEGDDENYKLIQWLGTEAGKEWQDEWNTKLIGNYGDKHIHLGVHDGKSSKSERVQGLYQHESKWNANIGSNGMIDMTKITDANWADPHDESWLNSANRAKVTIDGKEPNFTEETTDPHKRTPEPKYKEFRNTDYIVPEETPGLKNHKPTNELRKNIEQSQNDLEKLESAKNPNQAEIAKTNEYLNELIKEYRAEQVDFYLKSKDKDLSEYRKAQEEGKLTDSQAKYIGDIKRELQSFGVDADEFYKTPYIDRETAAEIKRFNQLNGNAKTETQKKNVKALADNLREKGYDLKEWGIESRPEISADGVHHMPTIIPGKNIEFNQEIDWNDLSKSRTQIIQDETNEENKRKRQEWIKENKDIPPAADEGREHDHDEKGILEGVVDGVKKVADTTGHDLGQTRDRFKYEPGEASIFDKLGGWEGAMSALQMAVGFGNSQDPVIPEEEQVDPMYMNHLMAVKRLSEIGMPLAEQAQAREKLDETFRMAKMAMEDASNGNRAQLMSGIGTLSANRQKGALAIEAKKSELRRGAMSEYGKMLEYVNSFKATQGNIAGTRQFEVSKMKSQAAADAAGTGLDQLIKSISHAKETGPGSVYDMYNKYMMHEIMGSQEVEGEYQKDLEERSSNIIDDGSINTPGATTAKGIQSAAVVAKEPAVAARIQSDMEKVNAMAERFGTTKLDPITLDRQSSIGILDKPAEPEETDMMDLLKYVKI